MSSMFGNKFKVSIFGESHGEAIGVVIDGLPSGIELDLDYINKQMARRSPGRNNLSTPRKESDNFNILSGFFEGKTTGTPLCATIQNQDKKSKDYAALKTTIRPGHSDYSGFVKYSGYNDYRGSGHFSGRITAPLLFAGAIAMQILEMYKGIIIGTRIKSIYKVTDENDINTDELNKLKHMDFPVVSEEKGILMQQEILKAKDNSDSVGGITETFILNVPAGYGEPFFDSVESKLSHMIFSIPAVKGIEFGEGFKITEMKGSSANDQYYAKDGNILTQSNNNGGILGGITDGMPIIFRTAIKPTPSISKLQNTVDISTMENTTLQIEGRHDPCIVPRAVPVIDGAAALVILDLMMEREGEMWSLRKQGLKGEIMKNIVLIGMPGSGKSTIGRLLSQSLNMKFIDMDDYIVKTEGKSVKELFAVSEDCFRNAETRCSLELSNMNSVVVAAGGGIIKRKENIDYLKKNSIIIFINRPVEQIIKDIDYGARPLLADGKKRLYELYNERISLYKEYSEIEIENFGTIQDTLFKIIDSIKEVNI